VSETLSETYTRLVPASRKPTREQQLRYLACREEGMSHVSAARAVGSTGRRFVSLLRRDPEFRDLYNQLLPDFEEQVQERIRHELMERAFDRDDDASPRLLAILAESRLSEMDYKRTRRVDQRTQHIGSGLMLDPRSLPTEQLRAIRDILAGLPGDTVIDAEVIKEITE